MSVQTTKIAFVIPIKPKAVSKDWNKDNQLLERTLKSILNQSNQNYNVFVVYTDFPDIKINDPFEKITFLKYTINRIDLDQMKNIQIARKYFSPDNYIQNLLDKTQRFFTAIKIAKEEHFNYIIPIDSDDLVSSKVVSYINQQCENNQKAGWYFDKGYLYEDGKRFLLRQKKINCITAGSFAIRIDLCPAPNESDPDFKIQDFFESHTYLRTRIKNEFNEDIEPIPFPALIYIVHKHNTSDFLSVLNKNHIKKTLKVLLRGRIISKQIKKDFSLYKI